MRLEVIAQWAASWVDRQGRTELLSAPARLYGVVDLSPNGERLAVHVADVTDYIWVYDIQRASEPIATR